VQYDEGMEHYSESHETRTPPLIAEHIAVTPDVCGGRPRIAGHRIRVQDIALWHERWGYSAEEIVSRYPQLTLADVHAALAYYYDHRDDIKQHIHDAETLVRTMKQDVPSKLSQKRAARDARSDPFPPG